MRYIYQNRTDENKVVALVSESKTSVSYLPLAPGAKLELSYPGLDGYVPHALARLNESGTDISHTVVAAQQAAAMQAAQEAVTPKSTEIVSQDEDATAANATVEAPVKSKKAAK